MANKGTKGKDQIVGIVLLNIISDTFFSLIRVKTNPYIFKKTLSLLEVALITAQISFITAQIGCHCTLK